MKIPRPRRKKMKRRLELKPPGTAPGTLIADPESPKPVVSVMAFGVGPGMDGGGNSASGGGNGAGNGGGGGGGGSLNIEKADATLDDVRALRAEMLGGRSKHRVLWVNVDGLGDTAVVQGLGEIFGLHKLALEDVLSVHQRAKVDQYPDNIFIVLREPQTHFEVSTAAEALTGNTAGGSGGVGGHFDSDQVSMFLGKDFVITFQEKRGDCFNPVRMRIRANRGKVCQAGPDYLVYSIIDAVVDAYFPVLESFGERLEDLEDIAVERPTQKTVHDIHLVKRELLIMRRSIWPAREALGTLVRDHSPLISDETRVYLRDAYDHLVQLIEILENYRELGSDLMDIYLSAMSNRMNEVMKVLTVIATIFMPLSFIVGIYGMNFDTKFPLNMPELEWRYGYVFVWVIILATAGGLLGFFYKRGWIGPGRWRE